MISGFFIEVPMICPTKIFRVLRTSILSNTSSFCAGISIRTQCEFFPLGLMSISYDSNRRVGFSIQVSNNVRLPAAVEEFVRDWQVTPKTATEPTWDFMWNTQVEEGREKALLRHAFTVNCSELPAPPDIPTEATALAESAVKVKITLRFNIH